MTTSLRIVPDEPDDPVEAESDRNGLGIAAQWLSAPAWRAQEDRLQQKVAKGARWLSAADIDAVEGRPFLLAETLALSLAVRPVQVDETGDAA